MSQTTETSQPTEATGLPAKRTIKVSANYPAMIAQAMADNPGMAAIAIETAKALDITPAQTAKLACTRLEVMRLHRGTKVSVYIRNGQYSEGYLTGELDATGKVAVLLLDGNAVNKYPVHIYDTTEALPLPGSPVVGKGHSWRRKLAEMVAANKLDEAQA